SLLPRRPPPGPTPFPYTTLFRSGADRLGRRPDEHEARRGHRLGERRPLGEEPVAGVERLAFRRPGGGDELRDTEVRFGRRRGAEDRKSTRLNSSHVSISYAVFCL